MIDGSRNARINHRVPALEGLQKLDKGRFDTLLVREFDELSKSWSDDSMGRLVCLVRLTDEPSVWDSLLRSTRSAESAVRLEIVHDVLSSCWDEQLTAAHEERIADFLAAFNRTGRSPQSAQRLEQAIQTAGSF